MNGSDVVLDTNQAIAILGGSGDAETWIAGFQGVYLPLPVIGELRFGAMNSKRAVENLARVDQLMSRCSVLDFSVATTEVYARVRMQLKQDGKPIPENDVWIAANCIELDLPVATADQHFRHVKGLQVIWR